MSRQALRRQTFRLMMFLALTGIFCWGVMFAVDVTIPTQAQINSPIILPMMSDEALITIAKHVMYPDLAPEMVSVVKTQHITYGQWLGTWSRPNALEPGYTPDLRMFIVAFHAPQLPTRVPGALGGPIIFDVDGQVGGVAMMMAHTGKVVRRLGYQIGHMSWGFFIPDGLSESALHQIALETAASSDYISEHIQRESSAWMRRGLWADNQNLLLTDEQVRSELVYAVALSQETSGDNGLTLVMRGTDGTLIGCRHRYLELDWRVTGYYPPLLQSNMTIYATPTLNLGSPQPASPTLSALVPTAELQPETALIENGGSYLFGDAVNYRVLKTRRITVGEFMGIMQMSRVLEPPEWTLDTPLLIVAYRGSVPPRYMHGSNPGDMACSQAESEGYDASVAINMQTGNFFMQTATGGIDPLPNQMFAEPSQSTLSILPTPIKLIPPPITPMPPEITPEVTLTP